MHLDQMTKKRWEEFRKKKISLRKKAATIPTMIKTTNIMVQQTTLPQHLAFPPLVKAPACSSFLYIFNPTFLGICPSAAI
jgi:hypothetical protein